MFMSIWKFRLIKKEQILSEFYYMIFPTCLPVVTFDMKATYRNLGETNLIYRNLGVTNPYHRHLGETNPYLQEPWRNQTLSLGNMEKLNLNYRNLGESKPSYIGSMVITFLSFETLEKPHLFFKNPCNN